jgi:signal transduction histidine kinase/CheY-like chemotaxis protein/HPt (histidine-containing phosphotransfer) domain-containing protein
MHVSVFFKVMIFFSTLLLSCSTLAFNDVNSKSNQQLSQMLADEKLILALEKIEKSLLKESLKPLQRFDNLIIKAKLHHKKTDLESAINTFMLAAQHAKSYQLHEQEAQANKLVGVMNYYKGNNTKALIAYQKSLEFYQSQKQYLKQAHLFNNIALVNVDIGEFDVALANYQQAQMLYVEYGDDVDNIDVKFNIAGLYNRLRRYDLAINIYKVVIVERTQRHDDFGVALVHGNLGNSYFNTQQYDLASQHFHQALNYYQSENLTYHLADELVSLAILSFHVNEIDESIEYANEAIKFGKKSDNKHAYASGLSTLAYAYFNLGEFDLALVNIDQSNLVSNEIQYSVQLLDNLLLMSLVQAAQGNTSEAFTNFDAYKRDSKELETQNLADKLTRYQVQFESEQLQREVNNLIQKEKLQALKLVQTQQQQKFWIGGILFGVFIIFFIYRSSVERRLQFQLAQKVKQRTQELELLMENLQHTNTIKNQFLANMSHEIRTPLTAVIGQAEAIIVGDVEPEFLLKEVGIIYSNSNHLLTLVNDILDLSRIEANKLELELKPFEIHKIVEDVSDLFKEQAKKKKLKFVVVNELPNPFVMDIDQLRLKQILINLCSNAIKFTYHGQVMLKVSADEHTINFSVSDTGIGLTEQQLGHIFNHFTQGDSSISRRFGGSGLGLCLSQQLALMMNGNITVNSQYAVGSEFVFSLSIAQYSSEQPLALAAKPMRPHDTSALSGLVLLADDHDDNRRLTKRLLNALGLDVVTASNGIEAIELFKKHKPALILLDIQMPEMDGIEAFKIIRRKDAKVPIIALTANAMSHEIEQYLGLGFDDYISKPIVRNRFIQTLAFYLKQTSTPEQSQRLHDVDLNDLALSFKQSFEQEKNAIRIHLASLDYKGLAVTVHRLSGAAAMFNQPEIASVSADIEKAVKRQNFQKAQELANQLIGLLSV